MKKRENVPKNFYLSVKFGLCTKNKKKNHSKKKKNVL